jgi:hypothetical protein
MTKPLYVALLSIFIASCGLLPDSLQPSASRERKDIALQSTAPVQTPSRLPEPTVDYEATRVSLASTQQAVKEQMIQTTAEYEQRIQEQLRWTQQADMMTATPAMLTQQSGIATSTAWLTVAPGTMTAQPMQATSTEKAAQDRRADRTATAYAPTKMIDDENSRLYVKYAEDIERTKIFLMIVIGVFILALAFFLFLNTTVTYSQRDQVYEKDETEPEPEAKPTRPMVKKTYEGGEIWLDATVPCTNTQLFELADGVINRRLTLSYGIWEGTSVHKSLKVVREFFEKHKFAKVVHNSNGQMDILAEGESFLRYVSEHGEPPTPFVCLPEKQ